MKRFRPLRRSHHIGIAVSNVDGQCQLTRSADGDRHRIQYFEPKRGRDFPAKDQRVSNIVSDHRRVSADLLRIQREHAHLGQEPPQHPAYPNSQGRHRVVCGEGGPENMAPR